MVEDVLVDFGLSSNEARVYLALLDSGYCTVSLLSDRAKLHRANVYDALKKLSLRGLVSFMKEDNVSFFEACDPSVFLELLKEKEAKISGILPKLRLSMRLSENSSDYLLFRGVNAFLDSLHSLLDKKEGFVVFNLPERAIKLLGARIFPFHKGRIERSIYLRQVYCSSLKGLVKSINDDLTSTRFFNSSSFVSFIVCGDEVLISNWVGDVVTIKVKNVEFAKSFSDQFEIIWSTLL